MCAYKGAHILGVSYYRCRSQWLTHPSVTWVAHIINIKCDIYYQEPSFGAAASPTQGAVNILITEQEQLSPHQELLGVSTEPQLLSTQKKEYSGNYMICQKLYLSAMAVRKH